MRAVRALHRGRPARLGSGEEALRRERAEPLRLRLRLSDGTELYVERHPGAGRRSPRPTLVLLHGGPGGDHLSLRRHFLRFRRDADLVLYDHRGMGRSDDGPRERWTLDQWAADAVELVERLEIERPVLVGQSFGGFVAQMAAARADPTGLVLSSTQARRDDAASVAAFRELGGEEAAAVAAEFFARPGEDTWARYEEVCSPLYNTPPQREKTPITRPDVLLHFWRGEERDLDLHPHLARISCPTLVVCGDTDPIIPAERSREVAEAIPQAEFVVIPDSGHGPFRDRPVLYARALRDFLARLA